MAAKARPTVTVSDFREFRKLIKQFALQKNMSSKELAIRSGYSEASISYALRGTKPNGEPYNPTLDFILDISMALEIGVAGMEQLIAAHPIYSRKYEGLRNRKTVLTMD